MKLNLVAFLVVGTCMSSLPLALSLRAPANIVANTIEAALFYDPGLKVSQEQPEDAVLLVNVNVKPCKTCRGKARALATLLSLYGNGEIGGTNLTTTVTYGRSNEIVEAEELPATASEAASMLRKALKTNTMFVRTKVAGPPVLPRTSVFVLFRPRVIQVNIDDLYSWGGMSTRPAADVMSEVFSIDTLSEDIGEDLRASTKLCNPKRGCA